MIRKFYQVCGRFSSVVKPIEISPNRVYNCAYLPIDHIDSFSEVMFLLLGGTGVGYSVQKHHVQDLEPVNKPYSKRTRRFLIGDSIEGWADAIKSSYEILIWVRKDNQQLTLIFQI